MSPRWMLISDGDDLYSVPVDQITCVRSYYTSNGKHVVSVEVVGGRRIMHSTHGTPEEAAEAVQRFTSACAGAR